MPSRLTSINLAFALAALLTARPAAAGGAAESTLVAQSGPLAVGKPMPTFGGFDLDGRMFSSRELFRPLGGKPRPRAVVISFFATWCEACKEHLPAVERVVAGVPETRGVLVDFGDEPPAEVRALLARLGVSISPVLADRTYGIATRLGVTKALPRTFVVDGAGNVSAIFEREGADFEQVLAREVAHAHARATAPAVGASDAAKPVQPAAMAR